MNRPRQKWALPGMLIGLLASTAAVGGVVEDFESYADTAALTNAWRPYGSPPAVTLSVTNQCGEDEGIQALRLAYCVTNDPYTDVACHSYTNDQDWSGYDTVRLWHRGSGTNSREHLLFQLQDGSGGNLIDELLTNGTQTAEWAAWDVDLGGAVLTNVRKVQLGVAARPGDAYQSGTVYFDFLQILDGASSDGVLEPEFGCYVGAILEWGQDSITGFNSKVGFSHAAFVRYFAFPVADYSAMDAWVDQVMTNGGMAAMTLMPNDGLDKISPSDIDQFALKCAEYNSNGVPVFVRFGHEMNGDWYGGVSGWGMKPDQYRTGFRQMADAIHSNAPLTAMVWAPNQAGGYPYGVYENMTKAVFTNAYGTPADWELLDTTRDGVLSETNGLKDAPYAPFYPGDEYVDWVGLTCYHFGAAWPWGENEVPEKLKLPEQFTGRYNGAAGDDRWNPDFYAVYAEGRNKPMTLAETAGLYNPGTNVVAGVTEPDIKTNWIEQVYGLSGDTSNAWDIAEHFPKLKSVNWFDEAKYEYGVPTAEMVDWRVSSNETVRADYVNRLNTWKWNKRYFLGAEDLSFDSDGDGLRDGWEWVNFHTLTNTGAGDADGDGANDHAEQVAGTQPTNAGSVFVAEDIAAAGGQTGFVITVRTERGMQYTVEHADHNLSNNVPWSAFANTNNGVGTWIETNAGSTTHAFIDDLTTNTTFGPPAGGRRYYRAMVKEP